MYILIWTFGPHQDTSTSPPNHTHKQFLTVIKSRVGVFNVSRELVEDIIASTVRLLIATAQFGKSGMTNMSTRSCLLSRTS